MIDSAVQQIQVDVQRMESLVAAYSSGWCDSVSEQVFGEVSSLASNAYRVYSDLYNQAAIIRDIKSSLTQLAYN
ncbi:MAG: hypothetical protein E7071_06470 [Bacteroidales bacterium]|nr:hypothetical protein [Bacteroidales bacterium]